MARYKNIAGFTLIELSIVLVIIGLIVGGILVGQNMILAAQVRKDISTMEKFSTATTAFRTKYNCLPGDCQNATSYGFDNSLGGSSTCVNGDGNGQINFVRSVAPTCWNGEPQFFFYHLAQANLIEGAVPLLAVPHGAKGQGAGGAYYNAQDWFIEYAPETTVYAGTNYLAGFSRHFATITAGYYASWTGYINPTVAYMFDAKIDDGLPITGNARAAYYSIDGTIGNSFSQTNASCLTTVNSVRVYDTTQTGFTCPLFVGLAF